MSETKTTSVLGYFNPHSHAVTFSISEKNLTVTLTQKNQYVVDSNGHAINDPCLERCCVVGGLARKLSNEPVPINPFRSAATAAKTSPAVGFTATTVVPKVPERKTAPPPPPEITEELPPVQTAPPTKVVIAGPITSMSAEEARRRGLIRPVKGGEINGPRDRADGVVSNDGKDIPELTAAIDSPTGTFIQEEDATESRPMDPADAAALGFAHLDKVKVPVKPAASPVQETPALSTSPAKVALLDDDGTPPAPPLPPSCIITETIPVQPTQTLKKLPLPVLDDSVPPPNPPVPQPPGTVIEMPFECSKDGRKFRFRCELDRWAKRKYPEQYESIMSVYPKTR